jgi:hypothetical protein
MPINVGSDRLTAALAALRDSDLEVLRELAAEAHGPTAGLLAAIEHAADWEYHRNRPGIPSGRVGR